MASNVELQEKYRLYKFTKVLTLKVAQIVVQSRQGKKITRDYSAKYDPAADSAPSLQWVRNKAIYPTMLLIICYSMPNSCIDNYIYLYNLCIAFF